MVESIIQDEALQAFEDLTPHVGPYRVDVAFMYTDTLTVTKEEIESHRKKMRGLGQDWEKNFPDEDLAKQIAMDKMDKAMSEDLNMSPSDLKAVIV